jgi:aryl-alcohol dehydrogenase-like predicted oxidoreductase
MDRRRLGKLEVSAIGLGCMSMSPVYAPPDPEGAIATIRRAPELGIDFIDTSDAYGAGANEELVGRAIEGRRNKFVLATKFGNVRNPDGTPAVNGKPDYAIACCEKSLKRLKTDVIDLYFIHRVDPDVPIEDTVGALATLVKQGKVRHIGISEASAKTIRRGHKVHPFAALQTEYSLWTRDVEAELLPLCHELGIGFVAYAPLGRGFLTGTITDPNALSEKDGRRNMPRFKGENFDHNVKLLADYKALAAAETCTPAQLALAWVLSRRPQMVPIAGTSHVKYLEENAAATALKPSAATLARLDALFKPGIAAGARYAPAMMARVGI